MNSQPGKTEHQLLAPEHVAAALKAIVSTGTAMRCHDPMANRTTLRVGGPADLFLEPGNETDLASILRFCGSHEIPVFVIGRGSNLLVKDGGIRGVVVHLGGAAFSAIAVDGLNVCCGAGARLKAVALAARDCCLSGLEFLEGIPGTVGGALRMNAGAMGSSIFDVVTLVRFMDRAGVIHEVPAAEMKASYRRCEALKTAIALSATLRGRADTRAGIQARMENYSRKRWASQPAAPSAGCMFKNPENIPAGKLIDELGLKGARVGGAVVSAEHGNFIVNDRRATAREVLELIEIVRARVRETRGISLETEVEIIGEQ